MYIPATMVTDNHRHMQIDAHKMTTVILVHALRLRTAPYMAPVTHFHINSRDTMSAYTTRKIDYP